MTCTWVSPSIRIWTKNVDLKSFLCLSICFFVFDISIRGFLPIPPKSATRLIKWQLIATIVSLRLLPGICLSTLSFNSFPHLKTADYNGFGGADNLLKLLSHKAVMLAWFEYISVDVQTYVSFQETPILRVLTWSSVKQGLCIQTAELEPPPNPL